MALLVILDDDGRSHLIHSSQVGFRGQALKFCWSAMWERWDREKSSTLAALEPDDADFEPTCDITGRCQPCAEEVDEEWAMCRHCGGQRKRDYPRPGNWGIPD